jgi:hypothetical protein
MTPGWREPREFIFNDGTPASEFARAFPELSMAPFSATLATAQEEVRRERLEAALRSIRLLEDILEDLPPALQLRTLRLGAVVCSLAAEGAGTDEEKQRQSLDSGVSYLERWHAIGSASAWSQSGQTPQQEVYKISTDEDLAFLYKNRKGTIEAFLSDHRDFLIHTRCGGGGGCIAGEVAIEVPGGTMPMRDVRVGTTILSASLVPPYEKFPTTVSRVYRSEEECVLIDGVLLCSLSQPLYVGNGNWIEAGRVAPRMILQTADGRAWTIEAVEKLTGKRQVFTLTTEHPTHNFISSNWICKNKEQRD